MSMELYKNLKTYGTVKLNVPLAKFTTFKIGGPADLLVIVTEREKLVALIKFLSGEGLSYFILGGGSNLLLPDDGLRDVVIKVESRKSKVEGHIIEADAGVSFGVVTMLAVKHGLTGLEWAAGLPGTVGGAVRGNAGAMDGDTARSLAKVEALIDGEVVELTPAECFFGYRNSVFKHNKGIVLRAWFKLKPGDAKTSLLKMQAIVKQRNGHYPPFPSAGSFFQNIQLKQWTHPTSELPAQFVENGRVPAGWLSEQAGLKGFRVGGAMVSEEHGNFIINFENATQADVLAVVEEVKTRVYNKTNIELEEEVQIIY